MEKNIHEDCGVAMIRLLKPLEYYQEKYGTWMYALNKLYLMMEKQHNRGQEGAGMASVKLDSEPGNEYMFRERAEGKNAVAEIFANVHKHYKNLSQEQLSDVSFAKTNLPFAGDLYMGHLRYSTTGKSGLSYVHPFLRRNNWKAKNLCMCGNFNMTNIGDVFEILTEQGQCPRIYSDTNILLELMGHRLDREVERNFVDAQKLGLEKRAITNYIEENVQMSNVLKTTMQHFDGGYVICGLTGSGEMFSIRDPWSIRPAFYYKNDEIVVLASERPVLQTTFDLECDDIQELKPGQALIVNKRGECSLQQILEPKQNAACSFERIYFSRGSDRDIYKERETLGRQLTEPVLKAVDYDTEHTVLSYIPNTAEVAFYGLVHGFKEQIDKKKVEQIAALGSKASSEEVYRIIHQDVRSEKVAWKDIKLRTFITEGNSRNDLASHVYDVTYECIKPYEDNLVIIDDSIVRGTTLKESILRILDRLHPKKIVVVSSAPQIRFPDYYGIDMPHPEEFCVFRAVIELIRERGMEDLLREVYENCKKELAKPKGETISNAVRAVYKPFTVDEINKKIVEMLRPEGMTTPVELVFQSVEGLHNAIPNHPGDWYFTGNYPTPGGMRLVNEAFVSYYEREHLNTVKA
ncbi:MAG: amidophosphoribosyltransferase [Prevotella sp.]|jgi:class II glutamine amidotransferase|uniref:Amidophosphoribosyltransferase n=1 Tax=Prevotella melaninogenica TaxID=28132 RepID=A0ABS6Y4N8_9BACT|nr:MULTISPECIES: amidophosphoribosyltransferase [Prevotella]ADK95394.1 class II glutamine amidotransferase [Prevotella melaninogenica ATCC 25845]ASE17427.1 amidophosphoribosyltransferase [Prevotella melaninogenica]MBF1578079.1 amidophosphoribosyltransferase [Prevotella sp.]MBF1588101.1 amidophosphoribosyltransferase [Prevotella sp.]MBF1594345.1 amidophosphoribosyltransferase [Prevotella sp.]